MHLGNYDVVTSDGALTLTRRNTAGLRRFRAVVFSLLAGVFVAGPFLPLPAQMVLLLFIGVATVPAALIRAQELAGKGVLVFVARSFAIRGGGGEGPYRDANGTRQLIVDGRRFDAARVRDVQVRVVALRGPTIYNLYVMLDGSAGAVDGCAVRVDGSRSALAMDRMAAEIRRPLGLDVSKADHSPEPVLVAGLALVVLLVLMHVCAVGIAAAYAAMEASSRAHLTWSEAAIGPAGVLAAELTFTRLTGWALRGAVRTHTRALLAATW